jgi:hypothetical protein
MHPNDHNKKQPRNSQNPLSSSSTLIEEQDVANQKNAESAHQIG